MRGLEPDAQALTIALLQGKSAQFTFNIGKKMNNAEVEQLTLCYMIANERGGRDYAYLPNCLTAILNRQSKAPRDAYYLYELAEAIGIQKETSNPSLLFGRMDEGKRVLKNDEIDKACEGFKSETDRRFWKNMLYRCDVRTERPDEVTDGPVLNCLQAVWDARQREWNVLPKEQCEKLRTDFMEKNKVYSSWFDQMMKPEGNPPQGLFYDFIDSMVDWTQGEILDCVGCSRSTWEAKKKAWKAFESGGPFPANRLKREQIVRLCLAGKADLLTTIHLLAMMGYCIPNDTRHKKLCSYLSTQSDKELLRELLTNYFPDGDGSDSNWIVSKVMEGEK